MLNYLPKDFPMLKDYYLEALEETQGRIQKGKQIWLSNASFKKEGKDSITLVFATKMYLNNFNSYCKSELQNVLDDLAGTHIEIETIIGDTEEKNEDPEPVVIPEAVEEQPKRSSYLNPIYTFESFIPCENTNFAYNAAKAIAMHPGINYNPCLIYGGVGLGKTHLLQSVGNYIEKENPKKKVIYVTAETFTNDFINSLQQKNASSFRIKYRKADVLLIDDIHFLQEKISTQEELFHTFNDLYESNKQIIFTCDRPISELKGFTDRLKSRFTRGLNLNLTAPDYETRVAILKKKCENQNVRIYDSVISYMAENIKTNVRDLEGSLTTLIAYSKLIKTNITLEIAQEQLKNLIAAPMASEQDISISTIVREVASYYNIETSELKGKKRTAIIKDARNMAIYLTRKITQYSTTEIGNYFDRDHSTITHSIDKVDKERKENSDLAAALDTLENNIRSKAK